MLAGAEALLVYSYDATFQTSRPDVVVLPDTTEQVAQILALASRHGLPVTPRGAGTGLSGGALAHGGISMPLTRMNRIKKLDVQNLQAVVEPGVVTLHLQQAAEAAGLFYPPDPASARVSTIGGNLAENAGGPRCFKYGVTRDYVLGLTAVLADGRVLKTGGQTVKNVTGYDLTRLLVGSEGTLAVITEATVRLIAKPERLQTVMAVFPKLESAAEAVAMTVARGVTPASMELMDQFSIRMVENYLHLGLPVESEAILLFEVDGFTEAVDRQVAIITELCQAKGATELRAARDQAEADRLWLGRRSVGTAITMIKPGKFGEDIAVPISQIPEAIRRLHFLRQKIDIPMGIWGHVGDGNLHPNIAADLRDREEMAKVNQALNEMANIALSLGGTLSGEHGIGQWKAPFLEMEVGALGIEVMRRIKQALDPQGILNPGKMRLDG